MRQLFNRFGALALVLAMMFGTVSAVSAQTPPPVGDEESESISITYDQVAYLEVSVDNNNVNLGQLDAFGIGSYPAATVCRDATTFTAGDRATYTAQEQTTGNVISSTPYSLTIDNITLPSSRFLVYLNGQCGDSPVNFNELNPLEGVAIPVPGGATTVTGDNWAILLGALVRVGDPGSYSSTFEFTITAQAI